LSKNDIVEETRKLLGQITMQPISCFCLFSDGMVIQGFSVGLERLLPEDKVDLAAYLIKKLGIDFSNIEHTIQLSDETKYMARLAKRIQEGMLLE